LRLFTSERKDISYRQVSPYNNEMEG